MKHVYELYTEWTKGRSRVAEGGIFKTVSERELEAFQAGMLASADIAERMYFTHTPDDGVISGEGVADEIRKRANDI